MAILLTGTVYQGAFAPCLDVQRENDSNHIALQSLYNPGHRGVVSRAGF